MSRTNKISPEQDAAFPSMPEKNLRPFDKVMRGSAHRLDNPFACNKGGKDTPPSRNKRRQERGPGGFNLDSHQERQWENMPDGNIDSPIGPKIIQRLNKQQTPRPKFEALKINGRNNGMLNVFKHYSWKTARLDNFDYYEDRGRAMWDKKSSQHAKQQQQLQPKA
eukprot:Gb_28816 [translate_table: standard]